MNREKAREMAELMLAYADGKTIQIHRDDGSWVNIYNPDFYLSSKYRVKPEPMEVWLAFNADGYFGSTAFDSKDECEKYYIDGWQHAKFREVIE